MADSDEYFDDLDSDFLQQVDAIEAAYAQQANSSIAPGSSVPTVARTHSAATIVATDDATDSDYFGSFAIDEEGFQIIDRLVAERTRLRSPPAPPAPPAPPVGPSASLAENKREAVDQPLTMPSIPRITPPSTPQVDTGDTLQQSLTPQPSQISSYGPRRVGTSKKRVPVQPSPLTATPPLSLQRLQRKRAASSADLAPDGDSPSPKRPKRTMCTDAAEMQNHSAWVDLEAIHSGDELSGAESEHSEVTQESDRDFIVDQPGEEESSSYEQSAVYRRSLLSQTDGAAPVFSQKPARRGWTDFGGGSCRLEANSEEPGEPTQESATDEYEYGSFVVEDNAEISYVEDTEGSVDD